MAHIAAVIAHPTRRGPTPHSSSWPVPRVRLPVPAMLSRMNRPPARRLAVSPRRVLHSRAGQRQRGSAELMPFRCREGSPDLCPWWAMSATCFD
eukprot:3785600-Prymnesium_polylepis.2